MKLENFVFKSFFYPFLIGIFLSTLVVTIFLGLFSNKYYDLRTSKNLIDLEKKNAELFIKSFNIFFITSIEKIQSSVYEQIIFYQRIANKLLNSPNKYNLNSEYFKSAVGFDPSLCENTTEEEQGHIGLWMLDENTTENDLDDKIDVKNQLIAFSNLFINMNANLETNKPAIVSFFFYFENTELYASYPITIDCLSEFYLYMTEIDYEGKHINCIDENGHFYKTYKVECELFFNTYMKSKTSAFDYNYLSNENRTIFITNFYALVPDPEYDEYIEYTMCMEFYDPITKGKAYSCVDVSFSDRIYAFENLNTKLAGYFFISNVGYNNVFYFSPATIAPLTITEKIFPWNDNFTFDEKLYFYNNIKKIFTSNYIDNIGDSIFDEVYVNGKNSSGQYFYKNGQKMRYSIYPIILQNVNGINEHIMSIIYVYNDDIFLEKLDETIPSVTFNIFLELIIFFVFGTGLLYIIFLTFNILAKYIVIPIKNVNYMLKGINIGGTNRLDYLDLLRKKQNENIEKLEKLFLFESIKNKKIYKNLEKMKSIELNKNKNNENNLQNNNFENIEETDEFLKLKSFDDIFNIIEDSSFEDFNKKYDEESNFIEKENCFYDFNEIYLQNRSLEIQNLIDSLINLKSALLLTLTDNPIEKMIEYSFSEEIFKNYKNKDRAIICENNIGILQSHLLQYDKAIYHLAYSLEENTLKKFLKRNINDEFDENDSLLNLISNKFNHNKNKEKSNILAEKQINSSRNIISKKEIEKLIKTRYSRLINFYYKFFKNIQKFSKTHDNIIKGQFMNTLYHTLDYYHKILIQYIYLSYTKNDLVKIGESILDYLEFLIKFKFKSSFDDEYFLNINSRLNPKYQNKQHCKKIIFDKIINWFNLFDDYVSFVKEYTTFDDEKSAINDINNINIELYLEKNSIFMFRINIQRADFIKGKFALYCKNYNDALFYFIRAAKKNSIIIDGLIKKKSLKHIFKILMKMKKEYENLGKNKITIDNELKEFKKYKEKTTPKKKLSVYLRRSIINMNNIINTNTFEEEIKIIKNTIIKDTEQFQVKEEKDIGILIDLNIYNIMEMESDSKIDKIDSFINQTLIILNDYLIPQDKIAIFIYLDEYRIIRPLIYSNKINIKSLSNDLNYYKNNIYSNENEQKEDIGIYADIYTDYFNDMVTEEYLDSYHFSENSEQESFNLSEEKNYNKIDGLIKTINYINYYLRMKETIKKDTYIILFTDMLNIKFSEDEYFDKIFGNLDENKEIIFLLVGENKNKDLKREKSSYKFGKKIERLILGKFNDKSENINFENMQGIKKILSNNKAINDEIIYPNEIYY